MNSVHSSAGTFYLMHGGRYIILTHAGWLSGLVHESCQNIFYQNTWAMATESHKHKNTFSTGFTCSKETYRVHTSVQRSGQSTTKAYSVLPSFIMWLHRVLQVLKCAELSTAHVYMLRNQCSYLYNLDPSCPVFSLFVSQRFDLFHKSPCRYTLINCSHADISWAMV